MPHSPAIEVGTMRIRKSALLSLLRSIFYAVGDEPILLTSFTHDEYLARLGVDHLPLLQKNMVEQLANRLLALLPNKLYELEY